MTTVSVAVDAGRHFDFGKPVAGRDEVTRYFASRYRTRSVLDVGCGSGAVWPILASAAARIVGIDLVPADLVRTRVNGRTIAFIEGDFMQAELPERYGAVYSSHTIEHVPDTARFLTKFFDGLEPGGAFCLIWPPPKPSVVSGHIHVFNLGLMLYNLVRLGIDCRRVEMVRCGYCLALMGRYERFEVPALTHNEGDLERLGRYFPFEVRQGFDGDNPPGVVELPDDVRADGTRLLQEREMETTMTTTRHTDASPYRHHLLPLIESWRKRSARVAIFGTGPHTSDLLDAVPELEELPIVAYLESAADGSRLYRDKPILPLSAVARCTDVVVCSSYSREAEQLRALDPYPVEAYPSHPLQPTHANGDVRAYLQVPTFGYPVIVAQPASTRFAAIDALFDRQMDRFRAEVHTLEPFFPELDDVPADRIDDVTPFWNNGYFYGDDARVAYAMVRAYQPARIIEIGGGNSTKFMHRAIVRNGGGTDIISIDPTPRGPIDALCTEVIRQPLQRVSHDVFDVLEPGDVLFMDGTHQVFRGTDSVAFYLHVLPRLKSGVRVHIHDITLPADYHDEFADRYYAEQYVLAALLIGSDTWRVTLPVAYLHQGGLLSQGGGSFWMERA